MDLALISATAAVLIATWVLFGSKTEPVGDVVAHILIVTGLTVGVLIYWGPATAILITSVLVLVTFSYKVSAAELLSRWTT